MRWWLVSLVVGACSAPPPARPLPPPPPPAHPGAPERTDRVVSVHRPIVLAVLALEPADPAAARVASDLTLYLRNRAREDAHTQLTAEHELVDAKLMADCASEAPPCMAKIGKDDGAAYILYGHVAGSGPRWAVTLTLLDVASQAVWPWAGTTTAERAALEAFATGAYDELTSHIAAP